MERYMNHCASLIQENYSKYQVRRSKSNPRSSKHNRISMHKKSVSNLYKQSERVEDLLGQGSRQKSKRVVDYMLNAKNSFTKAYNRFINNKDDANIMKKVKGHSARKESEYKPPLNVENSAQKMTSVYNSVEGRFLPKSARPVDCDYFQEDVDPLMNTLHRPKKDFLKRNTRKIIPRKVNWENVSRRIDCWNSNTKSLRSQKLSPRKTIEKSSKKPTPSSAQSINSIEEIDIELQHNEEEEENVDKRPLVKSPIHKLRKLYLKYHGDNQSKLHKSI